MHRFARHGLLTAVFFMLLITVWSMNLDFLISNVRHALARLEVEDRSLTLDNSDARPRNRGISRNKGCILGMHAFHQGNKTGN